MTSHIYGHNTIAVL